MNTTPARIFLSYAREDNEKVTALYRKLSEAGFTPWMDTEDILPGEKWQISIRRAIQCADFFLVCLSARAIYKRSYLQKEIKEALDLWQEKLADDIYLIPVRLEKCKVPELLNEFQWVNLYEKDGWVRLEKALRKGIERQGKMQNEDEVPCNDQNMATSDETQAPKSNLMISCDSPNNGIFKALVLTSATHITLGSIVELLVDHWDLPVWQDKPIAYDLYDLRAAKLLDLSQKLAELSPNVMTRLRLVAVSDRLVLAPSPADLPVFDIIHPDKKQQVSIAALPESLTASELQETLETFWSLPVLIDNKPAYYELALPSGPLAPYKQLSDIGVENGTTLELLCQIGIRLIGDTEAFDIQIDVKEIPEEPEVVEPETLNESGQTEEPPSFNQQKQEEEMTDQAFRKHLLNTMHDKLGEDDLDDLLFYLDIPGDTFKGTKQARMRELIQYYRRRYNNKLDGLLKELCESFPHVKAQLIELGCEAWLPE